MKLVDILEKLARPKATDLIGLLSLHVKYSNCLTNMLNGCDSQIHVDSRVNNV